MSNSVATQATAVTVSLPSTVSGWVRDELETERYVGYLRRVHAGPIASGDEWEEFVSRGCGMPKTVTLRVESIRGGTELGASTIIEYAERPDR